MEKISTIKIILLIGFAVFSSVLLFGNTARADDYFSISSGGPIFSEANFLPGDSSSGSITFLNKTSSDLSISFKVVYEGYEDDNNLLFCNVLYFKVEEEGGPLILNEISLTNFKDDKGVFPLPGNGNKTLNFFIRFDEEAGRDYNMIEEREGKKMVLIFDLEFTADCDNEKTTKVVPGMVAGVAMTAELPEETIPQILGRILGAAITKTGGSIVFVLLLSFLIASTCYLIYLKARSKKNKENCDI